MKKKEEENAKEKAKKKAAREGLSKQPSNPEYPDQEPLQENSMPAEIVEESARAPDAHRGRLAPIEPTALRARSPSDRLQPQRTRPIQPIQQNPHSREQQSTEPERADRPERESDSDAQNSPRENGFREHSKSSGRVQHLEEDPSAAEDTGRKGGRSRPSWRPGINRIGAVSSPDQPDDF